MQTSSIENTDTLTVVLATNSNPVLRAPDSTVANNLATAAQLGTMNKEARDRSRSPVQTIKVCVYDLSGRLLCDVDFPKTKPIHFHLTDKIEKVTEKHCKRAFIQQMYYKKLQKTFF